MDGSKFYIHFELFIESGTLTRISRLPGKYAATEPPPPLPTLISSVVTLAQNFPVQALSLVVSQRYLTGGQNALAYLSRQIIKYPNSSLTNITFTLGQ